MNPLKHYFRRPSLYFVLPSGKNSYPESVVRHTETGELAVYPLTAMDEMRLKHPDALMNGEAMVDVIKSCMPDILNPWEISTVDWEALTIALRASSAGNSMDVVSNCPACNEENTFEVDLARLLTQQRNVDYNTTLQVRELEVKFRPLTYREVNETNLVQYDLQRSMAQYTDIENNPEHEAKMKEAILKMNVILTQLLASTVEYIKTPHDTVTDREFIHEFLSSCDSKTNKLIQDHSVKLRQENELKPLKVKCMKCSHEYSQSLIINATDFFG
jgi:hypothetical protein